MDYYEDNEPDMLFETMEERRNHKGTCSSPLRGLYFANACLEITALRCFAKNLCALQTSTSTAIIGLML
jgi:hypothetical protein